MKERAIDLGVRMLTYERLKQSSEAALRFPVQFVVVALRLQMFWQVAKNGMVRKCQN